MIRLTLLISSIFLVTVCKAAETFELKTIADAYRLTDADCREPRPFCFTGTLLSSGPEYSRIRDATGGTPLLHRGISTDRIPLFSTVRVKGKMSIVRNGEREFVTTSCEMLHANAPDQPIDCTCADIRSGRADHHLVRIRGVISSVTLDEVDPRSLWASLRDSSGDLFLTCDSSAFDKSDLQGLVDSKIEVVGMAMQLCGLRHNLGRSVAVAGPDKIRILSPAPEDPFLAPPFSSLQVPHRQQVCGTVIGITTDRFFIRTPASQVIPILPVGGHIRLKPGTVVSAVGFATLDPYHIMLSEAIVRIDAEPKSFDEPAISMTIESLFRDSSDREKISMDINGSFLSLQGVSAQVDENKLALSSGNYSLFVDLTVFKDAPGGIPPNGSTIEVKGLCVAAFEGDARSGIYPKFRHFTIFPSSTADIRILSRPSWWTPMKLLIVIAALGTFLIGILIWNHAILVVSERRGKELYAEKIDHALAEQKVEERTRLAVELHDSVSQTLTGVALQLDGGEIESAKTMLASCRGELRRCLWDLRSRTFEEKDMTEAVIRTITPHLNGITATVRFNVPRERLSESLTHAILRIIRELVVNAIRHGQAKHVKIAGEMHENTVSFSVSDDGQGFVPETAPGPEQGHFGLLGIRERIEDFNGSLKIASAPNLGAKFTVTLTASDETNEQNKDTDR